MSIRNNGALLRALFNKIKNINIKWNGKAIEGYEDSEYVLYLFNPLELTCFSEGWINQDDYRESVHKKKIWETDDNWLLISDYIYDPVDDYFAPIEEPRYEL